MRGLGDAAREVPVPDVRPPVAGAITARRGAGGRVILPVEADRALPSRRAGPLIAAAVLVAAALAFFVRPLVRGAAASQVSRLSFLPSHPVPGTRAAVRYRPSAALAEEPKLALIARYIPAAAISVWNYYRPVPRGTVVATLERDGAGAFVGWIPIPDSAVLAEFAVTDATGDRMDNFGHALFVLVSAERDGRLSFPGLLLAARDSWRGAPSERARMSADTLVALYPDSAQSWAALVGAQGSSRIPNWLHVFDERERRFARLERAMTKRDSISAGEMEAMVRLASAVEDSAAAARWRARLLGSHPADPRAIEELYLAAMNAPRDSARSLLPLLESGWTTMPAAHAAIGELGLEVALNAGDSAAIRLWVMRALSVVTPGYVYWSVRAGRDPEIRAAIEASLRAQVRTLMDDSATAPSLLSTRERDRLYRRALAAGALGLLSQELLLDGRLTAARDTVGIAIAMSDGMCAFEYLHRYRASVELVAGDTLAAARDIATALTAGFQRTGAFGDSASLLLGSRYDATRWSVLLDSARRAVKPCSKDWATP